MTSHDIQKKNKKNVVISLPSYTNCAVCCAQILRLMKSSGWVTLVCLAQPDFSLLYFLFDDDTWYTPRQFFFFDFRVRTGSHGLFLR